MFAYGYCYFQVYRINFESAKLAKRAANDVAKATGMFLLVDAVFVVLHNKYCIKYNG